MILSSWSPSRRNGWWPQIWVAPNARIFVAYGNAECTLAELRLTPTGLETVREVYLGAGYRGLRWKWPFVLTAWRERPDLGKDVSERLELDVRWADWSFMVAEQASALVGGNILAARDGVVAEWMAPPYSRLRVNGHIVTGPTGGAVDTADGFVCYAETNNNARIVRTEVALGLDLALGRHQAFPCLVPLHQAICGPDGHIVYGGYGPVMGIDPAGTQQALTATPWKQEGPAQLWRSKLDGRVWFASTTWNETGDLYILLRPWGEQACVVIPRGAVAATIAEVGEHWLVASCGDTGVGVVDVVPMATARTLVTATEQPPVVPTFEPIDWPFRLQVFGGPGFKMNLGPAHDDMLAPPSGSFLTLGRDNFDQAVAYAREHRVPLYAYVDDVSYPPTLVPSVDGVEVIPVVQAYPYRDRAGVLRPLEETVQLVRATVKAMREARPGRRLGMCLAYYRQIDGAGVYNWPLQHVLDLQQASVDIAREFQVSDALVFHQNRGNGADGVVSHQALMQSLAGLQVAAADAPSPVASPLPQPPPRENPPVTAPPPPPVVAPPVQEMPVPIPASRSELRPDDVLYPGEYIETADGRTQFWLQLDHNIVLYQDGDDVWAAGTIALEPYALVMQLDGNLVAHDDNGAAVWATGTHGHPGARLVLRHGTAVIVSVDGEVLWQAPQVVAPAAPVSTIGKPSGARKPNIAKAIRDLFGAIFGREASGPKNQAPEPVPPHPTPAPVERPPTPEHVPEMPREPTRAEVLSYLGHLGDIRDSAGRVMWTAGIHGLPAGLRAEWLRIYVSKGATHIPVGPFDPGVSYPGLGVPDSPDWNDNPSAIRGLLDEIRAVKTVRGHGLIPVIFPDGCGREDNGRRAVDRIGRSYPTVAEAIRGIEHLVIAVIPGWEPHDMTAREQWDAHQLWFRIMDGRPKPVTAWHGWPERSNGASNDPFNRNNDDPFLADRDPVTGAAYGSGATFWQKTKFDMFLYQMAPIRTMAEANCGHIAGPGQGVYPEGCWLDNFLHAMCRVGGVGTVDGTGAITGGAWVHKTVVLFETTTYYEVRNQTAAGVTQRVNDRALELSRHYGINIGFGTGLPAELETR